MPAERKADRAGQSPRLSRGFHAEETVEPDEPAAAPAPAASTRKRSVSAPATSDVLATVKRAARARARCEERTLTALQEAVREARPHHSLREIAEAAGVSYDTVDRWTKPD